MSSRTADAYHMRAEQLPSETPVRTTVFLLRHCDVENPKNVAYGFRPYPLSELGRNQARTQGRFLADKGVTRILSSPLPRAQETGSIVARQLPKPIAVETSPNLTEAPFERRLEGLRRKQVPWRRPSWWVHKAWPGLLSGDESAATAHARLSRSILKLVRENPGETGVCISHGDPIRDYWKTALNNSGASGNYLGKGGMLQLEFEGEKLRTVREWTPEALQARAKTVG